MLKLCRLLAVCILGGVPVAAASPCPAQAPAAATTPPVVEAGQLFAPDNLVAWCIVPFDAKKRTPAERADMLQRLGFKHFAYDWRAEHLPTLETELDELDRRGIELTAVWFPALDADGRRILDLVAKRGLHTQLWVTGGGGPTASAGEQRERVTAEANRIRPIAEAAARLGCQVGLYNHGGWFGEPENQLAIIDELKLDNVGLIYNLHHGHQHLDRLPALLEKMLPRLWAVNLNGMVKGGDAAGRKILPLGQGNLDLEVLRAIRASGYRGHIGILGHTDDDAEDRLRDNLDGLAWVVPQLEGRPAGPATKPRTAGARAQAAAVPSATAYLIEGRPEYRTAPLTVELRATLRSQTGYNILVASDTKQSGAHWELFTVSGSGLLAAYLPGAEPDHVRTTINLCDSRPHDIVMLYEPQRVRLYVDGKPAGDGAIRSKNAPTAAGSLAVGQLVEGGLGCDGRLDYLRLSRGAAEPPAPVAPQAFPPADDATLGYWRFDGAAADRSEDLSKSKNPARRARAGEAGAQLPPEGVHLEPVAQGLKVRLIDRSPNDAYLGVRVDSAGQIFVGSREAVFVFVPDGQGGYLPRRRLLEFPPDSIIIGLEFRGDDLYVLAANALYRVPGGRVRHADLRPERILWGLPLDLHVSFHCLAWGPQGDLYLNHGDPLLNYGDWSRPDHFGHWSLFAGPLGTRVPYTGQGCVLRVAPDGSRPRVVAGGLRGPVGLAFDDSWNLLTNDNDHESRAELYAPSRLLHVTPQIDFGWPRGWMASKSPERAGLVEPVCSELGRGVPCDLAYYHEPLLADAFGDRMLMCRWDAHSVTGYRLRPRGASLAADEETLLRGSHDARPVGIAVGPCGQVFVTALYMTGNTASPYCASDLLLVTRDGVGGDQLPAPYDITQAPADRLSDDLGGPSWQRRYRAQQELLRRGGNDLATAARRATAQRAPAPASIHGPWLLAAALRERAADRLIELAGSELAALRCQALAALAEVAPASPAHVAALRDADPPVQLAALAALGNSAAPLTLDDVQQLACSPDPYLRQTACRHLAEHGTLERLAALSTSSDAHGRLAAVLALGMRLTTPAADDEPPAELPLFLPAGNAFFKTRLNFLGNIPAVELAALGRVGSYTTAERWARTAHRPDDLRRVELLTAALQDSDERVQLQAAWWLGLLRDPTCEPLIERTRRELATHRLAAATAHALERLWLLGPLPADAGLQPNPEQPPIDLDARYDTAAGERTWQVAPTGSASVSAAGGSPARSFGYFSVQSGSRQQALLTAAWPGEVRLLQGDRRLIAESDADAHAHRYLVQLQPGGNDFLLELASPTEKASLGIVLRAAAPASFNLPERLDNAELAQRLAAAGNRPGAEIPAELLGVDWPAAAKSGNADSGRRLFGTLGCVKCHSIAPDGEAGGGPSLYQASRRLTLAHLVESILLPSKQVAEPFRATRIATTGGVVLSGLIVAESAADIELLLPDASRRKIAVAEIDERSGSELSPMPTGLVKTRPELADLLAYLLSERPLPP